MMFTFATGKFKETIQAACAKEAAITAIQKLFSKDGVDECKIGAVCSVKPECGTRKWFLTARLMKDAGFELTN